MNYLYYLSFNFLIFLIMILLVLIGVAFLTLLERKMLGYLQNRKGPAKVGYLGILQPFSEAVKLFSKEMIFIMKSNYMVFYLMPILGMLMLLIVWMNFLCFTNIYFMNYSILMVILILSLNSYFIILMGWSSNSVYSFIGSMRSVAQVLSYEVSFILIILIQMFLSESFSMIDFMSWQKFMMYGVFMGPVVVVFFVSILAELNRSPMDFIEGESELVSGFNVEYFSGPFALIFLSEYGMIIFMSYLMVIMYFGFKSIWFMMIMMLMLISVIILMRGILPRMRYDELMYLCWKIVLPIVLNYVMFYISFKIILNILC